MSKSLILTLVIGVALSALSVPASAQRIASVGAEGPLKTCLNSLNPGSTIQCSGGFFSGSSFTDLESFRSYAGDLSVGGNIAFSFGDDGANLYSELVGANLHLGPLGYARAGFGALVSANDDSTASTADQFFDGGGNASFFVALPAYYRFYGVRDGAGGSGPFLSRRVDIYLIVSIGADIPELNTAASDRAFVGQFGPQISLVQNATDESIRLFATLSGGYARGTEEFYENTGVDTNDFDNWGFLYGQATFGIDLNGLIRIGASFGESTIDEVDRPFQLSVQLLPQNN